MGAFGRLRQRHPAFERQHLLPWMLVVTSPPKMMPLRYRGIDTT